MMKSRPSAIKLRLSRLIRCLVALGCIKLIIMGVALFDLPMPSWGDSKGKSEVKIETAEHVGPVSTTIKEPIKIEEPEQIAQQAKVEPVELPQGSAAAELAAASKPRSGNSLANSILPAPLTGSPIGKPTATFTPMLPTPASLGAPLAKAGIILPVAEKKTTREDDSLWDIFDIKSLPIPGLGSAQAAHAAALDMPVPSLPGGQSPFTPAEQIPGQQIVLPGAPPLPANIPSGESIMEGAPQAPRSYSPGTNNSTLAAPAPNIAPQPSPHDPNIKSQDLARQQQEILMLRQQMDQRLKDLQNAEDKMKGMIREAKDMEEQKIRNMVQTYANMKPRMAAQALEKMDERIAVRILSGMAPKQSGEILTYTNPSKTAKLTEMMTRMRLAE